MFKRAQLFLVWLRNNSTLKLHQKANNLEWYRRWHGQKYHKLAHTFVAMVCLLLIILFLFPIADANASLVTRSFTKTSTSDFQEGNISDLLSSDDELSMHLGKKVGSGFTSTDKRLANFNNVRSIVRGSDNKIHIVWVDWTSTPRIVRYANSTNEGSGWSDLSSIAANPNITGVLAKIDGSDQIHVFWSESVVGLNYIKHRVRGVDSNWGSVMDVSNSSAQGAVADWQAVPQGDHFGNYYDTISGQYANVTRTTPRTIYDSTQNKIFDVPAGKLGVRPRIDGNDGYEAEIEETRTNYLLNSSFENDSNSDGLSDSWANNGSSISKVASRNSGIHGSYSQRILVTGQTAETAHNAYLVQSTAQGTFAAGEAATASIYFSSVSTNTSGLRVYVYALNSSNTIIGSAYSSLFTTAGKVTVTYPSLPVNTTAVRVYAYYVEAIDEGDIVDVTMDAIQLEKGAFATSYIPTTTTSAVRNADMVTVPTTGWSTAGITVATEADIYHDAASSYIFSAYQSDSSFFGLNLTSPTTVRAIAVNSTNVNSTLTVGSTSNYGMLLGRFGENIGVTYNSSNSDLTPMTQYSIPSNAFIGSWKSGSLYFGGSIHRVSIFNDFVDDSVVTNINNNLAAGTWEGIIRTPIADWQVLLQGDHYGNFYDSVSGSMSTITRNGTKTIYDNETKKIYDVPANYLGVRPRSDGKPGYEAEIEESRTNYLLNSSFVADSNNDGLTDNWVQTGSGASFRSIGEAPYGDAQGVTITGSQNPTIEQYTVSGSFAAGQSASLSFWYKMNGEDGPATAKAGILAYQDSVYLGLVASAAFVNIETWTKVTLTFPSLPAGTNRVRLLPIWVQNAQTDTSFNISVACAQLEKGSSATSFIPTADAPVTRIADSVTVPTTGWSPTSGAISADIGPYTFPSGNSDRGTILSMGSGNSAISMYSSGWGRNSYGYTKGIDNVASYGAVPTPTGSHVHTMRYSVGTQTSSFIGITKSTLVNNNMTRMAMGATASIGSSNGTTYYINTSISRITVYGASLPDNTITNVSNRISNNYQSGDLPNPFVDSDGDIAIAYNKGNGNGVGFRTFDRGANSWSSDIGSISNISDHSFQNVLRVGTDVYYFYTLNTDNKRYLLKKTGNAWGTPLEISSFAVNYASEIIDSNGNIWIFVSDQSLSDKNIKFRKYGEAWTVLDSESGKDIDNPQITVDGSGNLYAFYNIGNEIAYKIRNISTSQWSSRVMFTDSENDGEAYFPNIRYQKNFQNSPNVIDILYRQSSGGNGLFSLNYGTIGGNNTGTYLSPEYGNDVFETSWIGGWGASALVANINLAANTEIKFYLRTGSGSNNNTILWDQNWIDVGTASYLEGVGNKEFVVVDSDMPDVGALPIGSNRYLQIKIVLDSLDGTSVPILYDYTLNYLADENDPIWEYPESVPAFSDNTKLVSIPHDHWGDKNYFDSLYFDWSGATEPADESGISNYYVYFGIDNTADPFTAGIDKGALTEGLINIESPVSGSTYYLRITVVDDAGNSLDMPSGQSLFTYRFDNTRPLPPTNYSVSPIGWSTTNNFTFAWQAANDPGNGASEIKGYEYKRAGGGDSWNFVAAAPSITIPDVTSYQDGINDFYIRSVDNAGNNSGETTENWTVIHYYFNGTAPSKPENVTVTPQQSSNNSFTFNWEEPLNHNSAIKGYYYSINVEPTLTNSVYTTALTTGAIPAATVQGLNKFYVAAVDVANDQILGAVSSAATFECNTTAPGIPGGLVVSDSSNMAANDWALTTKWQEPETGEADHYNIYRSTDGENFTKIAQTGSTGYLDSGLSNTSTYYYKITAVDNASAESAFSSVVSKQPTGKFNEPPIIVSGPEVDVKATNAAIVWSTNRNSSSFISYGKEEDNLESKGQLDSVTAHEVNLSGLEPGSKYYYRVQSFDENRDYPTADALSNIYSFKTQSAPGIEDVSIKDISLYSAIVSWKTTSSATSKVMYGRGTNMDKTIEDKSGSQVTIHTVRLDSLSHSTTYNIKITGTDIDSNKLESDIYTFTTLVYPKIFNVRFEQQKNASTSTLKVTWDSNVPLNSIVEYRVANGSAPKEVVTSRLTTKHSILVSNLKDNTDYLMIVKGRDAYGNLAYSDRNKVKTDFDTRPPAISNTITESEVTGFGVDAKGQFVVSWETDEPSTSQVEYGIGSGGDYTNRTQEDSSLTTSHVVIISDLKTSSPYHFRVLSKDASDNEGRSDEYSALTPEANTSVFDAILNALDRAIGWLFRG